ncbi:rfaE bifunctional protein, domain I/rfaE bifunctional protein, domain II [Lentzea xinjiangensis]|uniref:D-glycero-beta-D-manno-heptose 1-phosphate adenylyltransferase n=1 Tax=Lentzea xinjiangensis TaxID=402600 RepID=A0A1H9VHR1_9PSEU|nr:D-glycero-beta-D-manno-heptose 1-phosphate adenylyltransferase [Lentzea xinjiangensis]SES21014.1 rfaE bifunctional protein, domain I/rfaE bifunctional protein, domain II [Lentzea xinjiangensis]
MKLVVVGDALLDVDVEGTVDRLCPDAPAPVLDVVAEHPRAGGAALAATMAARDGVDVTLVSALSDDSDGERLRSLVGVPGVFGHVDSVPVKTRLRSAGTSLARMDRGGSSTPPRVTDDMLDVVLSADVVLASDYGRGLLRDERLRSVLTRVPVVWDPHPRGPAPVPGARLVTPNLSEATAFSGTSDPDEAARTLLANWQARAVVVTMGGDGAVLHCGGTPIAVPAPAVAVADPCGAGDRFAVTAAVRLAGGAAPDDAVADAVAAAAEFLARGGVSGMRAPLPSTVDEVRRRGGVVVATGGCFDVLHTGHVRMLAAARALGDCLVVCLNSDQSVRRLKGEGRPVNRQEERIEVLRALESVDDVIVFGEDTPENVLGRLRPDVWVKGGDYTAELLPENAVVRRWGGRTVVVPYHRGRSTTEILARRG